MFEVGSNVVEAGGKGSGFVAYTEPKARDRACDQECWLPAMQRVMTISVIAGLTIEWKQFPNVQGATLSGSVVVANQAGQDLDLTVVVVAVNDIGRATTLGYQHFTPGGEQAGPVISFSSSPGLATYLVHADAIARHPGSKQIYRARKQTSQPLPITQH